MVSHSTRKDFSNKLPRLSHCTSLCIAICVSMWFIGSVAEAQVTAESLLGRIVDISPKYNDVNDGIDLFKQGKVAEALEKLRTSVSKNPELPPAEILLAKLLFAAKQSDAGRTYLEIAAKDHPQDPDSYLLLAELALAQRHVTDAEALVAKSLPLIQSYRLNPRRKTDFETRANQILATVAEGRQHWNKAEEFLQKWLTLEKNNPVALRRLGQAQFKLGKEQEAYQSFRSAKQEDPTSFSAEIAMAMLYEESDNKDRAKRFIEEAQKTGRDDAKVQVQIAQWYLEAGEIDTAKGHVENAAKLDPTLLDAKILQGIIARMMNDLVASEKHFADAHLLSPNNFAAANQLALVLAEQPDETKQRRALELATANRKVFADSNNTDAISTLGWVYYLRGQNNAAQTLLNEARRSGGLSADGAYYVARIYHNIGNFQEAKSFLDQAMKGKLSYPVRKDAQALAARLDNLQN